MTSRTYLALMRYIGLLSVPGIWYSADDWWKTQVFAVARGIHLCGTQPVPRHRQLVPVHSANYRGLAKLDHKQDNCTVLGTAACPLAAAADVVAGRWTAAVGVAVMRTCIDCWLWIALSYKCICGYSCESHWKHGRRRNASAKPFCTLLTDWEVSIAFRMTCYCAYSVFYSRNCFTLYEVLLQFIADLGYTSEWSEYLRVLGRVSSFETLVYGPHYRLTRLHVRVDKM